MDSLEQEKMARFKARIGFDQRPRALARGAAADLPAIWPDPLTAPGVAGAGWALVADTSWREKQGSAREWVLRRGAETLIVLAYLATAGEDGANDFFLARTCNTMTLDVPYVAGPEDLGSLSAQSPNAGSPYLIWVSGRRCIELKSVDTALDLLAIARWLQAHLDAAPQARGLAREIAADRVTLSAASIPVGATLELRLEPGETSPAAGYLMELEYDHGELEVLAQDGLGARLRGLRAGPASLTVHGINLATLESSRHVLSLNFMAAGSS